MAHKNRRAVYILPNLFTTANILAGFYSIILTHSERFITSAWVIMLAVLFDNLDGKVARLTHTESQFGVEYDSLSDLISFGVAPAFLIYVFVLNEFGRLGIIASFLFVLTGALRLARFNVQASHRESFIGLPIPGAAAVVASMVLLADHYGMDFKKYGVIFLVAVYILAFLMISTLKYRSFKSASTTKRISIRTFALIVLLFSLLIFKPYIFIPLIAISYALLGLVEYFYRTLKRFKGGVKHAGEENTDI